MAVGIKLKHASDYQSHNRSTAEPPGGRYALSEARNEQKYRPDDVKYDRPDFHNIKGLRFLGTNMEPRNVLVTFYINKTHESMIRLLIIVI